MMPLKQGRNDKVKIVQLIAAILISITLVGCRTGQQVDAHNSSIDSENAATQNKQDGDKIIYGENGLPPLQNKILDFYKEAYEFYQKYYMCGFQLDYNNMKVVNGLNYYQVMAEAFSTQEELENQIKSYFTGMALNDILSEINYYFIEEDGILYALDFGSSANLFYCGHIFQLVNENDEKIELKLIRYLAKDQENISQEAFYTIPLNLEKYEIEEFPIVLEKEGSDWKLSEIHLVNK